MPNMWTHIFFAEDVCSSLSYDIPDSPDRHALFLGAQGPDPFFYYRFWPWLSNQKTGQEIGHALHTKECGSFLMHLIEKAQKQSDEIKAYVMGFITHHLLDLHTHPYIHYRSGYQANNHQKLETIIDTKWALNTRKMELWKHPAYKEINVGKTLPASILYLLDESIRKYYPELSFQTKDIQIAYQDMITAQKLFADPAGLKNKIFMTLISPYSHQPVNENIDYLNEEKSLWIHSATGESHTESFEELYADALDDAVSLLPLVIDFWDEGGKSVKEQLIRRIGNISYDTGTPLANHDINRFSVPIV
ncbi:zinc dependent phospholipase C family protein [Oceanobacillus sp. CFH 90083]|uniref:zinc dependent phospholipase C family protein n=1 Tax=Oceanobacillus sp. CFH 90083 TaxID=2592336 RepID=UPI00128D3DD9|nr:zinc dependent phospholipase C family protein [Oceanobacillus sp. CFH 90083]